MLAVQVTSAVNSFSSQVNQKIGDLDIDITAVETNTDLVMSASEKLIAGYNA